MKSRPLKVGEYRKVKTWEQLLATEGAKVDRDGDLVIGDYCFTRAMSKVCCSVFKIIADCGWFTIEWNGDEYIANFFTNDYYDENGNEIKIEYTWVDDINPLDQLEIEAKQTLAKITKLREIEAKQAEIDTKIEEQNKRIEEYEKM